MCAFVIEMKKKMEEDKREKGKPFNFENQPKKVTR
jgi:hypothetical protein